MLIDDLHEQYPKVIKLFKSHNLEYLLYKEWKCEKSYPYYYHFENFSLTGFHRKFPEIKEETNKCCFVNLYENGDFSFSKWLFQKNGERLGWEEHGYAKINNIGHFVWDGNILR